MSGPVRDDRRAFLVTAAVVMAAFSIGAALQTVFVFRPARVGVLEPGEAAADLAVRLSVNLVTVSLALAACHLLRLGERRAGRAAVNALCLGVGVGAIRYGVQCVVGIYREPTLRVAAVEIGATVMVVVLAVAIAHAQVAGRRRIREQEREAVEQRLRAASAFSSLAAEESRVRREVADDLHGTLQGQLVLVQARIDALLRAEPGEQEATTLRAGIAAVREELDRIRETEIRAVSHRLHPAGVSLGLEHALRLLARTIPPEIEVETVVAPLDAGDPVAPADADTIVRRVAVLRAAEEAVSNAVRHGGASRLRLELDRPAPGTVRVRVDDDGRGLPAVVTPSGIRLVSERLEALGGGIQLTASPWGGARLVATVRERGASVDSEP